MNNLKLVLLLTLVSLSAYAQKLPNKQTASLRAPATIKIDGKTDEWKDQFQAFNSALLANYTLSNDDENLYLIIKVKPFLVVDKIIRNGVVFTINHTVDKKDTAAVVITYPMLQRADRNAIANKFNMSIGVHDATDDKSDPVQTLNTLMAKRSKNIGVKGIKEIADDSISVYNDTGVKAAAKFAKPLTYVYELAIPLKYLNLPNNGAGAFSYHIQFKAGAGLGNTTFVSTRSDLLPPPPINSVSVADTDMWGQYKLAR
ncbi:hypothetical protein [Mucilaginibacter myungsuensis]|uniref:Uncharacterized protein n=1 Tax=Mucilaginibacter myungsuensis TaxID=649104 RepID=A0A929KZR8_9SPHI|nr:hypothetical protein [Mucilaginibacter myungsuensis]MBE9663463.1 hypothetical protein [Mucilaginibacter myungsuensis]MDN3600201.1 hypothetical protein [Mucilaginibacter myungsuensis]